MSRKDRVLAVLVLAIMTVGLLNSQLWDLEILGIPPRMIDGIGVLIAIAVIGRLHIKYSRN